jgi:ATP-dependent DNA helicase RecG
MNINLRELAQRESEQIEWKENVADIDNVIRTVVAFANDFSNLGGGYIVCGAREDKDPHGFQKLVAVGLNSSRLKEVEGKVLNDSRTKVNPPIVPEVIELPSDDADKRILIFVVPSSPHAHAYRADGKNADAFFIRVGRETREATNGILRELLVRKKALEPWDRRVSTDGRLEDIDPISLRAYLQEMQLWDTGVPYEDYLSSSYRLAEFVPPLTARVGLEIGDRPRNFSLLMFGKMPTRFFPGAYVVFSIYPGKDRSEQVAERKEITGNLVAQAKRLIELINAEAYTAFDKESDKPNQLKYPRRALQEAVVNALVHRDYELDQPARITVFSDRIEINSPGSLPRTVKPELFVAGKASPFWRNQSLAYFFNKLQLAQAEGQGIPTIIKTMAIEGCPAPRFDLSIDHVICTLPAHPRHEALRTLAEIENRVILGQHDEALERLERLLDNDPHNFRALELFAEVCGMVKLPGRLAAFIREKSITPDRINPGTVILLATTLLADGTSGENQALARDWLSRASSARLELAEIKRVALAYRKLEMDEQAVEIITTYLSHNAIGAAASGLFDLRARAYMDLAKKCAETAKNRASSTNIKAKAWDKARAYLNSAESDLRKALELVDNTREREFMEKDMEFLHTMKNWMQKPPARPFNEPRVVNKKPDTRRGRQS